MSNIVFRVDSSILIGSGHIARCLTLAKSLQKKGGEIHFICRHLLEEQKEVLSLEGITLHFLEKTKKNNLPNKPYADWLGTTWEKDAEECIQIILQLKNIAFLIIDHYSLEESWETAIRPYVHKILVIDDLANSRHDCDIVLDQNFYYQYAQRYQSCVNANTVCLLGPKFALLRPEFFKYRKEIPRLERPLKPVQRINICFGGVDAKNNTLKTLLALPQSILQDSQIDIMMSSAAPYLHIIQKWIEKYKNITLHISSTNIAELLALADFGIGAGGTMTWERASVGLPSIVIAIAENQEKLAEDTARAGIHLFSGKSENVSIEKLQSDIIFLLNNPELRQHFAENSIQLTDGRGTERVANHILIPNIQLREVSMEDCDKIFSWRNASINRQFSHNDSEISYETHQTWLQKILQDKKNILLIAYNQDGELGVLRFDENTSKTIVSIYLVPGKHGEGFGVYLIQAGLQWLRTQKNTPILVQAEIKTENIASLITFERAGFKKIFSTFATEIMP